MPLPKKLLQGRTRDYGLGRLLEMSSVEPTLPAERRLLGLVLPPWQRKEVWTYAQKVRFIEGIFLGLGCGYYVTNGLEWLNGGASAPMSGWLIDGQQRICAVRDFYENGLTVFGDVTYASLDLPSRLRFERTVFPCFELDYTADENTLKELYDRLNFGGTPHTAEDRVSPSAPFFEY